MPQQPNSIQARVKYLINDENLAKYIASTGGGDITEHQGNYRWETVTVSNARLLNDGGSLDKEGFVLGRMQTNVSDFYSDGEIEDIYENEIKDLVKKHTGCREVEIFDHTRRSSSVEVQKKKMIREAASIIHNDYTARSGPVRLKDHYPDNPEIAEDLLSRRFAIVNVWRSIKGIVQNAHIAFCDASSSSETDFIPVERIAKERIGEIQLATYNKNHRWYYYPHMTMDEALLFKTYDSEEDGRARFTVHTAIDDPEANENTPARESIETRCFVFF